MFTGIVAARGRIASLQPIGGGTGLRLRILAGGLDLTDVSLGDSIAIQGACMTVTALSADAFEVEVSQESLRRTVGLDAPGEVNLEKAMRLGDRLGGHMVSGHVDGVGTVSRFEQHGESWLLDIVAPRDLARFLAYKGSVTVDGVSLTVNRVTDRDDGCEIAINLIPHTLSVTTLARLAPGARVNLEIDLIARYVERIASAPAVD